MIKLLLCLIFMPSVLYSQLRIDSTISPTNIWLYDQQKRETVFLQWWERQLEDTLLKVRPNQYFELTVDGRPFRLQWYNTTGIANNRKTYWRMTYPGAKYTKIGSSNWIKVDTLCIDTVYLSYRMWGERNCLGEVKYPADSSRGLTAAAHAYIFSWLKYKWDNPDSAVVDTVSERLVFKPMGIDGSGSTSQAWVQILHSEIPKPLFVIDFGMIPIREGN